MKTPISKKESSKNGSSIENREEKLKRAELIISSQLAGNTAGTPELKRILNNLVKHKLVSKEIAKSISK